VHPAPGRPNTSNISPSLTKPVKSFKIVRSVPLLRPQVQNFKTFSMPDKTVSIDLASAPCPYFQWEKRKKLYVSVMRFWEREAERSRFNSRFFKMTLPSLSSFSRLNQAFYLEVLLYLSPEKHRAKIQSNQMHQASLLRLFHRWSFYDWCWSVLAWALQTDW